MAGGIVDISASGSSASSRAYVYCVDSWTGAKATYCVAAGSSSAPDQSNLQGPDIAYACIQDIYQSGNALIMYKYPDGDYLFTVIEPPDGKEIAVLDASFSSRQDNASMLPEVEEQRSFTLLSNPSAKSLDLLVTGKSGENWTLTVFDISGRCVLSDRGVSGEGNSVLNLNTESIPSGTYMIRVEIGGVEEFQSISIVH
jgi:hypothetical protein